MPKITATSPATVRYATSLFQVALDRSVLREIDKDMRLLASVLTDELGEALLDPRWSASAKLEAVKKSMAANLHSLTLDFFEVLASRERIQLLPAIAEAFASLMDKHDNVLRGVLESAKEVDSSALLEIEDTLSKKMSKKVSLTVNVNPELLGGVCVTLGGIRYDGSATGMLQRLRAQLDMVEI